MGVKQHASKDSTLTDDTLRTCALPGCGRQFRHGDAHNLGHDYMHSACEKAPMQCTEIEHFTCCHEHAVEMAKLCLSEHEHFELNPNARFTHPRLAEHFECEHAVCSKAQPGTDTHGIVVTYRMPGTGFPVFESDVLLGCCEEHAKAAAIAFMETKAFEARHPKRLFPDHRKDRTRRAAAIVEYRTRQRQMREESANVTAG